MTACARKIVFVIGAGASREADLPTGEMLKEEIRERLTIRYDHPESRSGPRRIKDPDIYDALLALQRERHIAFEDLLDACKQVSDGMLLAASIDNYLNSQQGDTAIEVCGKVAIAQSIIDAERKSKLALTKQRTHRKSVLDFEKIQNTWFQRLFFIANEDAKPEGVARRLGGMTFVIFNYDRCVEHFLYHAVANFYPKLPPDDVRKIASAPTFFHPYGSIGSLPWRAEPTSTAVRFNFGGDLGYPEHLVALSGQIRTFSESTSEDAAELEGIRNSIREASDLVFLGFGFHKLNVRLLFGHGIVPGEDPLLRRVYASGLGLPEPAITSIVSELANAWRVDADHINLKGDATCTKLLTDFERQLSMR